MRHVLAALALVALAHAGRGADKIVLFAGGDDDTRNPEPAEKSICDNKYLLDKANNSLAAIVVIDFTCN